MNIDFNYLVKRHGHLKVETVAKYYEVFGKYEVLMKNHTFVETCEILAISTRHMKRIRSIVKNSKKMTEPCHPKFDNPIHNALYLQD